MEIIRKDSEETLLQALQSCWKDGTSARCFYLSFSTLDPMPEAWFEEFVRGAESFLDDRAARIFLCHDDDVFILARHMTGKTADLFLTHLTPILSPASLPREGLALLFEVAIDRERLKALCARKIDDFRIFTKKAQERKAAVQREEYRRQVMQIMPEKELLAALPARRAQRQKPRVMVVEDDPFTQKLVKAAIDAEHEVASAQDGREAILSYAAQAPDVLFLDIGLPDINGHDVLEKIFEIDPQAYVVMLSGNGDRDNVLRAVSCGAKGFVGKPFTRDKLLQYIRKSPFIHEKLNRENAHANSVH